MTVWNELISFTLDLSSTDGSNYSSTARAAKAKQAAERSARGGQSSLPPSSPPEGPEDESPSPSRKRRKTTAVVNNNMPGCDDSEVLVSKKPGTLSSEALEEIRIFSDEVKSKADQLGRQFGRSTRDILVAAGFGIKPSHSKVNEANLFRSWYWATQSKPEGCKDLSSPISFHD